MIRHMSQVAAGTMTDNERKAPCIQKGECCNCGSPLHNGNLGVAVFLRRDGSEHAICGDCKVPALSLDCEHRPNDDDDDAPNLLAQDLPLLLAAARVGKLTQPQGVALVVNVDRLLRRVNGLTDELMRPKTPRRRR